MKFIFKILIVVAIPFINIAYSHLSQAYHLTYFADVEYDSLKSLYLSTNGPQWTYSNPTGNKWNFTGEHNPCDECWQGIMCNCTQV
jgi:hypothetical protein